MTENEKLRALLAEARKNLYQMGKKYADSVHDNMRWTELSVEKDANDLHARIDAALAEPVSADEGLTLRDQFAMAAIPWGFDGDYLFSELANHAYKIADEMLRAREKKND